MSLPDATLTIHPERGPAAAAERAYLLVLSGETSSLYHLPPSGEVVVGRAPDVDLRLDDQGASRRHAKLVITQESVRLQDLDSHNGTFVNGERVATARVLCRGDVISLCSTTLVFHRDVPQVHTRSIGDEAGFRQRLEEELERAGRYGRPLAVGCLEMDRGGGLGDRPRVALALSPELRLLDVVAWGGAAQLLLLLPELDEDEVRESMGRLVAAVSPLAAAVRAGVALHPADGGDADTLLSGARAAARGAAPGQVLGAAEAATVLRAGDRDILVAEPAMLRLYELIRRLAGSDLPILINGETGTGKEFAAAAMHHWSGRRERPFVALNCAALPETLVESELFGHERGAYSGAVAARAGLLASAEGGTVFLDEVGELPLLTQAKLLRVLETRRVTRLGDVREREIDIRIVAATNRDLKQEVAAGRFRQDLLFRLGATVVLLPLRERQRELPLLARALLAGACARARRGAMTIGPQAMQKLQGHHWPGNIRELKNLMDYLAATVSEAVVESWHVPELSGGPAKPAAGPEESAAAQEGGEAPSPRRTFQPIEKELRELERTRMLEALEEAGGVQSRAAELLGMPRRTFTLRYKQYGLGQRSGGTRGP